ncbi:MAG: PAS domain-containing protein, partial [Caldilineaceae bacterium]|nr:PAS domain-containing protein [Caldilineaceae bacterium]
MRRLQISRLIIGTGLVWLAVGVAGGWLLATTMQQPAAGTPLFWGVLALLFAGVGGAVILLRRLVRAFLLDVHNLAEAGQIALTANSNYRVDPGGHPDVAALAQVLNAFMERYAALRREQSAAVQRARADLEEERNLLAALMAELTDGVLVCNQDGQILLYNRAARTLLDSAGNGAGGFVGLGRSIFGVIDRSAIAHAVDQVGYRHRRADHDGSERAVMASFVTATAGGRIVRARLAPFASQDGAPRGYVVTLQDMSEGIERSTRRDALLQVLTERVRAALGAIRAASETIETFPQMAEERRTRLQKVVHDEAQSLSDQLNQTLRIYAADLRAHWRLEEMPGRDLLWAACRHLQDKLGATVHVEEAAEELWLKIDSYALVQGLTYTARRLKEDFGVSTLTLVLDTAERFATLDLRWVTPPVDAATW